jgi:hypothetical protein
MGEKGFGLAPIRPEGGPGDPDDYAHRIYFGFDKENTMKYVEALFGDFRDAYVILKDVGNGNTHTSLDANDVALVLTEEDGLQLFLPANGKVSERGLALVEIFNSMCRDKAGVKDAKGRPIPENGPYQGFTQPFVDKMKSRTDG